MPDTASNAPTNGPSPDDCKPSRTACRTCLDSNAKLWAKSQIGRNALNQRRCNGTYFSRRCSCANYYCRSRTSKTKGITEIDWVVSNVGIQVRATSGKAQWILIDKTPQ